MQLAEWVSGVVGQMVERELGRKTELWEPHCQGERRSWAADHKYQVRGDPSKGEPREIKQEELAQQ